METVIVITEQENTTPTFAAPPETLHAVVGMETVVSYNISDDNVTADNLSIVPVTTLPSGMSVTMELSDSVG